MRTRKSSLGAVVAVALAGTVVLVPVRAPAYADPVLCDGRPATLVGSAADDVLTGTPGPDVIAGLAGDDRLVGLGGDDVVCGDDGADVLEGGDGADRLLGGLDGSVLLEDGWFFDGGDTIRPGPGDDHVDLGEDTRQLEGDPSADLLDYGALTHGVTVDLTRGTGFAEGIDSVVVAGVLHVMATPYDDVLIGSGGNDYLCGGDGDDELQGLAGRDVLDADGFLGETCAFSPVWPEPASRPAGDDRLEGGAGRDVLVSRAGDDVMIGAGGSDQLAALGLDGLLVARGGAGGDFVSLRLGRGADLRVRAGSGRDDLGIARTRTWKARDARTVMHLDLASGALGASGRLLGSLRGFEDLTVGRGTRDPWRVRGTAGRNTLYLGYVLAPVHVLGGGGRDVLVGGHDDDRLDGGPGRDRLIGRAGEDRCLRGEMFESCERRG